MLCNGPSRDKRLQRLGNERGRAIGGVSEPPAFDTGRGVRRIGVSLEIGLDFPHDFFDRRVHYPGPPTVRSIALLDSFAPSTTISLAMRNASLERGDSR